MGTKGGKSRLVGKLGQLKHRTMLSPLGNSETTSQKGASLSLTRRLIRHVSKVTAFEHNDDNFAPSFDAYWWRR